MKRIIVLICLLSISAISIFAQQGKMEFTQKKIADGGFTVYFHVQSITSPEHAQEILSDLLSDNNINNGRYFKSGEGKDRFQLYINEFVTPEYVRNILLAHNVDFDFSTVSIDGYIPNSEPSPEAIAVLGSPGWTISAMGFPKYQKTGNKEIDDANYDVSKDKWIQENPEEYNKMLKDLEEKNIDK